MRLSNESFAPSEACIGLVLVLGAADGAAAPWIAPYDPLAITWPQAPPRRRALMGTDQTGRDI